MIKTILHHLRTALITKMRYALFIIRLSNVYTGGACPYHTFCCCTHFVTTWTGRVMSTNPGGPIPQKALRFK